MYLKKSKKIKIISKKDIVSLMLIAIMLTFSLTQAFGNTSSIETQVEDVTTRNLAMFAALSYVNLEDYGYDAKTDIDKSDFKENNAIDIVTDEQLKSTYKSTDIFGTNLDIKTNTAENTYDYLFYGLASTSEVKDWKIINYSKIQTTKLKNHALFTAMTFKKDNNIVIAYRGTDFEDLGDWLEDVVGYGLLGETGQEGATQKYAKAVAEAFPDANIYITGHSLGGFLAQMGGAALIEEGYSNQIKGIEYFNGIGLQFISNLNKTINDSKVAKAISKMKSTVITKNKLGNSSLDLNCIKGALENLSNNDKFITLQEKAVQNLKEYYSNGGILVSHQIKGDVVSALGTHYGDIKKYTAYKLCVDHHGGNKTNLTALEKISQSATVALLKIAEPIAFSYDISEYVKEYNVTNIMDFAWTVHETDSFFGVLEAPIMEVEFTKVPSSIKYKKTDTVELSIRTNVQVSDEMAKLVISNLTVSNKNKLSILRINRKQEREEDGKYIYEYVITIKGGKIIGYSTISLNPGIIKIEENSILVTNIRVTSSKIRTRLI